MAIKTLRMIKLSKFSRFNPNTRDQSLWSDYHGMHKHSSEYNQYLREKVFTLFKNFLLRESLRNIAKKNNGRKDKESRKSVKTKPPRQIINEGSVKH